MINHICHLKPERSHTLKFFSQEREKNNLTVTSLPTCNRSQRHKLISRNVFLCIVVCRELKVIHRLEQNSMKEDYNNV